MPTDAAREVLPRLTRGFDTLGQAVQSLRDSHRDRALSIAALPCIAQLWVSPRLAALQRAFPGLQVSVSAMEQPPDPRREPHDLAIFYLDAGDPGGGLVAGEADTILPVCAPALAAAIATPADLARQTLLHDAVWRGDWARWLAFAGAPATVDATRGPSLLALQPGAGCGAFRIGVLMGRTSLIRPHLADGRLVAPFASALPTPDRLTIIPSQAGIAHPRQAGIIGWLMESA